MRYPVYILLILISLILQITIFAFNPVWGITPDLLLITVISLSLLNGYRQGAYIGFIAGILQDVFSSGLFGINTVTKMLLGYIFGFLEKKIYHRNIVTPLFTMILATVLNQLLVVLLTDHIMLKVELWNHFKEIIFPLTVYHLILALAIYPTIYFINNKYFEE